MKYLAIDPGPEKSGIVVVRDERILLARVCENAEIRAEVEDFNDWVVIEMPRAHGIASGDVMRTAAQSGIFAAWAPSGVRFVSRDNVKWHFLRGKGKSSASADSRLRAEMITRYGKDETRGVTSHAWQALALASYAADTHNAFVQSLMREPMRGEALFDANRMTYPARITRRAPKSG